MNTRSATHITLLLSDPSAPQSRRLDQSPSNRPFIRNIHIEIETKTHSRNALTMSSSNTEHLATDSVGPSSGHGSSATLHSHHDSNQSTTTTTSGPGHAHSVAQAQGLKLDTAAAGSSSGSTAGRSGSEEGSGSSGAGAGTGGGPMEGSFKRPGGLAENPNARSKTITLAEGENTYGVSVFGFEGFAREALSDPCSANYEFSSPFFIFPLSPALSLFSVFKPHALHRLPRPSTVTQEPLTRPTSPFPHSA